MKKKSKNSVKPVEIVAANEKVIVSKKQYSFVLASIKTFISQKEKTIAYNVVAFIMLRAVTNFCKLRISREC